MPKQKSYTVTFKLDCINWHKENGGSIRKTAGYYGVDRKRVREWLSMEEELLLHSHGKEAKKRRINCGTEILNDEIEEGVLDYLVDKRSRGIPVSNIDLKQKALDIAKGIDIEKVRNFKASDGWLRRWKRRNRVAILRGTSEAQKIPEDYSEQIKSFVDVIRKKRMEHAYTMFNIGNMDQTMCRFDMAPSTTNNVKNQRSVRIATTGGSKRGFTVALCALASGHKRPAYICFKEAKGIIPPRVLASLRIPSNVIVTASTNGWMTGEKMAHWINRVWGPDEDDVRRLIVLDRARIHTMPSTVEEFTRRQTDVTFIPGGCTPLAQPADVAWNAPFKCALRKQWTEWREAEQRTPQGNLKMATRQEVINWVSVAWSKVTEETVVKSFKYCGISNSLDGSEDRFLSENMNDALKAAEQADRDLALLFESDSESEFDGFTESDLES